jgi:hypothetical protein
MLERNVSDDSRFSDKQDLILFYVPYKISACSEREDAPETCLFWE